MSHFTLLVGSTLGNAEDLAEVLAETLRQQHHRAVIHTSPQLDHILIRPDHYLLLVCSTHGAGDLPDNIQAFYRQLLEQQPDLAGLAFLAVGLGDSSYDTFCHAIRLLEQRLTDCGARRIADRLEIDVSRPDLPEVIAGQWLDRALSLR
ncbi:FMN-binding protein MioC [Zobellella iuensis]|uniref:FMN-binding protein MioC n=1 Tax=Zobellella iuensis TaxID=2803811 RepID=A0ABS1QWS3_9GAMM|nr:FMN-binding protein MioC [Zobellella iuensis]MBL1379317.1 FMN-binding protein MioC [Zobellella iuensis]